MVNRCICNTVSFSEALLIARREGCRTVRELQRHSALGTGCGLCVAYMQCAIETGRTDLPVFDEASTRVWMMRSGLVAEGGV